MNDDYRVGFVRRIAVQINSYTAMLEHMLGPRDNRFVFHTVGMTTNEVDNPQICFPNGFHCEGNCAVDVHISSWPWKHFSPDQSIWQVAHESVHLLDPVLFGSANVLEEGLATWFQNECKFHDKPVRRYIENAKNTLPESYARAKELVLNCDPSRLCSAVRDIRASGVSIHDIDVAMLRLRLPRVSVPVVESLCNPFHPSYFTERGSPAGRNAVLGAQ